SKSPEAPKLSKVLLSILSVQNTTPTPIPHRQSWPTDPSNPPALRPNANLPLLKTGYLVLYNAISTILWGTILGRVLLIAGVHGTRYVFPGVGEFAKWTQTLALLEVVHAAVGELRFVSFSSGVQRMCWASYAPPLHDPHASRLPHPPDLGHRHPFPQHRRLFPIYSTMLIAWSITEVIRYSYFAINLSTGSVPSFWLWLRYNTFFVLYPLGISSECWLVWLAASGPAKQYTGVREGLLLCF
ncbi:unnamed protein product, partial [Aureobasidium pullulans]